MPPREYHQIPFTAAISLLLALLIAPAAASGAPSVYATNAGGANVSLFDAAPDGLLTPHTPPTIAAASPDGIAVSVDQQHLYVVNSAPTGTISQYDIGPEGTPVAMATPTVAAGASPTGIAVSPDGENVYVTNGGSSTVSQYDVAANGSLSPMAPATVAVPTGPSGVTVSPDGASVYVTSYVSAGNGVIAQFDAGAGGALSPKSPAAVAAGSFPFGIVVSPDGDSLYSTELNSSFVRQYDVASNGTLAPKDPETVSAGTFPSVIAIDPDGESVYVTNQQTDNISQYDVGTGGKLAPKSTATVAAGDNPFGIAIDAAGENVYVVVYSDSKLRHYTVGAGGALTETGTPQDLDAAPRFVAVREDVIGPVSAVDSGPTGAVASRDASFTFSSEPDATFECALDGAAFTACTSPRAYTDVTDGAHTFSVRATDPWANTGPAATRSWTVEFPVVQPPEEPPPNEFSFAGVKRDKKKGTATLTVRVPGPGGVRLAGSSKVKAAATRLGDAGDALIPVRAAGKAKKKLKKRGKVKLPVSVTFSPDGGDPRTQGTEVTLKRKAN